MNEWKKRIKIQNEHHRHHPATKQHKKNELHRNKCLPFYRGCGVKALQPDIKINKINVTGPMLEYRIQ